MVKSCKAGVEWGLMNIIAIVIAVVIVTAGVYFSQRNRTKVNEQAPTTSEVLSEEETQDEQPTPTTGSFQEEETPPPGQRPSGPEATPSNTPTPVSLNLSEYQYPNSQVVSSTGNSLMLNSSDDTDKITDWYKEKIIKAGMNAKTFVKTKTNDNVLNKLVGADGKKEIKVEISKDSGESIVKISVTISSSS